jgi:serine/threonine protein kinase
MNILDAKGKRITLTNSDFVAAGGEGSIYKKNNLAYKIYSNFQDCLSIGKIKELSVLKKPNIINPLDIITDIKGNIIGYTMPFVKKKDPLCKIFVRSFLKKQNLSNNELLKLIFKFREDVDYIHQQNILIVDLNEMNFLFSKKEIIFIDTDSYQTKSYPAKVIMENIRDWSIGTDFNENSDWYSWGIITHQIFTGIHPFGGSDPNNLSLKERMSKNLSIFDKNIKIPRKFKDRSLVPSAFEDWYKAIFQEGKRLPPPKSAITSIKIQTITPILSTDKIEFTELLTLPSEITSLFHNKQHNLLIETKEGIFNKSGKKDNSISPRGKNSFCYKETEYLKEGINIFKIINIGNQQIKQHVIECMPHATSIYNGIVIQTALDTPIFTIFPTEKTSYSIPVKSLTGYRIINAKFESKTIILLAERFGKYTKFVYLLDKNYEILEKRKIENVSVSNISFAVLDNGIVAHILEEETLELFVEKPNSKIKQIKDPMINTDMNLFSNFSQILFFEDKKLYRMKTK